MSHLIPRATVMAPVVAIFGGVIGVLAAVGVPSWALALLVVVEIVFAVCAGVALRRDGKV